MIKKKVTALVTAVVVSVGLTFSGIAAINAFADNNAAATGTASGTTEEPGSTETPGTASGTTEEPGSTETPGTNPGTTEEPGSTETPGTNPGTGSESKPDKVEQPISAGQAVTTAEEIASAKPEDIFEFIGEDIVADIPAAILKLGNGDVTLTVTEFPLPAALASTGTVGTGTYEKLYANKLFDLKLTDADGNVISDFQGNKVELTLKFDDADLEGLDKANLKAFYFKDNKIDSWFNTTVNGNDVTFATGHFSTFGAGIDKSAVTNNGAADVTDGNGTKGSAAATKTKTGDSNMAFAFGAMFLASAAGAVVVMRKKANN